MHLFRVIILAAAALTLSGAGVANAQFTVTGTVTEVWPAPVNATDAEGIRVGDSFTFVFEVPPLPACEYSNNFCSGRWDTHATLHVGPATLTSTDCTVNPNCSSWVNVAVTGYAHPDDTVSFTSFGGMVTGYGTPMQIGLGVAAKNWFGPAPFPFPSSVPANAEGRLSIFPTGGGFQVIGKVNCSQVCIPPLSVSTSALSPARSLDPYGPMQMEATGGSPPYTWTATGLPPVLPGIPASLPSAFDIAGNGLFFSTGSLPTRSGLYNITFTVYDSKGGVAQRTLPLNVTPASLRYLHRYYNADLEVEDHFYTDRFDEVFCFANGWFYEGTIGLLAPTPAPGRAELLRYWNPAAGDHLYTINPSEVQGGQGYVAEGSVGYVFVNPEPGTIPLYRWYSAGGHDNFYTTDAAEHLNGYDFVERVGYVIAPPPYVSGCGDLHDEKVRHAIAHAFEIGRQRAASFATGTPGMAKVAEEAMLYTVRRREDKPTDTVLRDAEYFLIGFDAAFRLSAIEIVGRPILITVYNLAKAVALGLNGAEELRQLLQQLGHAGTQPNTPPGGNLWHAKGILAGLAGRQFGTVPSEPLVPLPDQASSFSRSIYFSAGVDGAGSTRPVYVDPRFNTRVEWALENGSDTFFSSIVAPAAALPPGAALRVVVGGQSFALVPDQPFEFARDAGLTSVSKFDIDATAVTSTDLQDYVLGVTFTAPSSFVWLRQTDIVSLSIPNPIVVDSGTPSGAVVTYDASAAAAAGSAVSITCTPSSGSAFPVGQTNVSCSATDVAGNTASGTFTVTVLPSAAPQPISLGTFSIGEVWAQLHGEFTWALEAGSTLPTGLSIRTDTPPWFPATAHAGIIGVAITPGTYSFTLLRSGAPQLYAITIVPLVVKDDWILPDAFANDVYSYQLTALNATAPIWSVEPATLPQGMSLDPPGRLSGAPAADGTYNFVVSVADNGVTISRQFTLHVYRVRITTAGLLPNANLGAPYQVTIAAAGGTSPYTFSADNLPPGLLLHPDGTMEGTPQDAEGHWWFNVTARDVNQASYTKVMSLVMVNARPSLPRIHPYDGELKDCSIGISCIGAVWVGEGGRAPFTWTATGLPPGMSIATGSDVVSNWMAPANLEIWGTPTQVGTFPVQLRVEDADGRSATNTFPLRVRPMRLFNYLPVGMVGTSYSHRFMVIGGRLPYTAALAGGRLPFGLTLDPATLTVSGTPEEDGNFHAVFEFTDADGSRVRVHNFFTIDTTATVRILDDDDEGTAIAAGEFLSFQFTACCAASYVWSIDGGTPLPGLTLSPDGVISGTPPAGTAGTFTFRVRASDASNPAKTSIRQFTVTVTPLVVSGNFPVGEVGAPYNGTVTVSGGSGVTWSLEPFEYLPPGLTVQPDGSIVGTPAASGRFSFELRSTDAAHSLTWDFTIDVYPAGMTPLDLPLGPDLRTSVGPTTYELRATGGSPPYSYSLSPGALAIPGMRIQEGQPLPTYFPAGVAAGLIGVTATPGLYSTSIRVTDALGQTLDRAITVNVVPLRVLSQTSLPRATVGVPYSFDLTAYGAGASNWQAENLPGGLAIDASTGRIFGTPAAAGTFFPFITLTDVGTSLWTPATLTLTVDPYAIITAGALPEAAVGSSYLQTLAAPACGAPCTWSIAGGTVPGGLALASGGTIAGIPTQTGTFTLGVRVSGSSGVVQKTFSIRVASSGPQPLSITTTSIGDITVGTTASVALLAQGGTPPYQWSVVPGAGGVDPLPPGVTLQMPGEALGALLTPGIAYLTGRPMQANGYGFTLKVTDAAGTTRQRAFSWNVSTLSSQYDSLPLAGNPLVYNIPYAQPLLVMGGTGPYTFTSGAMPPGLSLPSTGVVTGAPANTGRFTVAVQAVDAGGNSISRNVNIAVSGPTATTLGFGGGANLGTVQLGDAPTFVIDVFGGTGPYTLTALSPLPPGFAGTWTAPGATGPYAVTGIATTPGVHTFTLRAQDAAGNIGVQTFTLTVASFTVPTPELPDAAVGVFYSAIAHPMAVPSLTWSSTGPLPSDLHISADGVISGMPGVTGTFTLSLQASDGTSTIAVRPTLRISNTSITANRILPIAIVGTPFSYTFTAAGGGAAKNWFATGLPDGLTLSPSGTIEGIPRRSGTFSLDVWVSDGGQPAFARFAVFVRHPNAEVLDITTAGALPEVIAGRYGWIQLDARGGVPPYQWTLAPGSAPPPGGALISGSDVPPALGATPGSAFLIGRVNTPGSYSFEAIVTDAAGTQARRTFTLKVSSVGWATAGQRLPVARTGADYRADVFGVGGTAPYTFSATAENTGQKVAPLLDGALGYTLLPGLTLTPAGVIHGTPTSTGFYRFILHVKDAVGLTYATPIELTVASASNLVVTTSDPDDIPVGSGGSSFELNAVSLSANTFTYSWSVIDGALPPGMLLVAGGYAGPDATAVAGRPATEGTYSFTVRATNTLNASDTADHVFTIHVTPFHIVSPAVAFESHLPGGHVGEPYSTTIKVAGGAAPGFFVTDGTTLPPGLVLSSGGVLSGTPTHSGQYTIALTIKDLSGHVTDATLPLEITTAGAASPLIAGDDEPWFPATNGAPYLFDLDILAKGGSGTLSWSLAAGSALPPGLTILPGGNGVPAHLGGIPTADGEFSFSLTVSDATGQTLTIPVTLFILPAEARVIANTLPPGVVGVPYSARVIAPIGEGTFTSEVLPFLDLPPGLTLNGSTLAGTPQAPGNFVIAVRFVNVAAQWDVVKLYLVTIDNAAGQAPAVSLLPNPVSIYYEIGSPSPAPTRVFVETTSGNQPVQLHLSGAPWGSLDAVSGTASTQVNLHVNAGGLAPGTYFAMLGASAPGAVNVDPAVPVLLNVSVAPVAAPGGAAPVSPIGITTESHPIFRWTASAAARYYLLSIEDGSGTRREYWYRPADAGCADGLSACAVIVPRALAAGPAQWKVLTWNAAGYGPWSAVANVFVHLSNGSLAAPVVVGPSGATPTRTPSYVWNTVAGATWYLLTVTDAAGTTREYPTAPAESCTSATCTVTPATGMPLGAARWRVRAGNAAGGGAWSALIDFTVTDPAGPPGQPVLVSPALGASVMALPVTFRWNAVPTTSWYLVRVFARDHVAQDFWYRPYAADCALGVGMCSVSRPDIEPGPGTWQVIAWNPDGYSPWSDTEPFWLEIADPAAGVPQPVSPAGPTLSALVQYRWSAVPGAVGYRVMIHNVGWPAQYSWITPADAGCAGGVECAAAIGISVTAGVNAEWQVQAWTGNGHGDWSAVSPFTIAVTAPARPTLVSPEGPTNAAPSFTWNASANVAYYYIQVDDPTGRRVDRWLRPADVGCGAGTGTCTLTPGVSLGSGAGSWRVIAWNPAGYSPWSLPHAFTVP